MNDWDALLNCDDIFKFKKHKNGTDALVVTETCTKKNNKPNTSVCDSIYDDADSDHCFACMYIGEYDMGAIRNEDLLALMDRQRKCIGKVAPRALARDLANRFLVIQSDYNSNLRRDQEPLPDMDVDDWMNHWLYHNTDAELQAWLRMWEKQKIAQTSLKAMFVKNDDTGETFIDEKQNKIYNDACKEMENLYKSDVTKKQYYSGGAILDSKAVTNNGTLSYSGKNIISYMKRKKNN